MLTEFTRRLHERALSAAKSFKSAEKELIDSLQKIEESLSYLEFGVGSLFEYARRILGLTENVAYYTIRVARAAKEVPALQEAIDTGTLSVSQARQVAPILTKDNANSWIVKATTLSQREIQKEVAELKGEKEKKEEIKPLNPSRSELRCGVSSQLEQKLARLKDILSQKLGHPCTLEEALDSAVTFFLEKKDPLEKARRAKEKPTLPKKTQAIPASVKNAVLLREGGRCAYRSPAYGRCEARRHLHFHHILPKAEGGEHTAQNIVLTCANHHRLIHRGEWRSGRG